MKSNTDNRRPSGNIMMRLAAVLFCLVMFSTYLMGGLYARYVTRSSGSDSARVAKFDVVGTGDGNVTVRGESAEDGRYTITVTNHSEVDVSYDVDLVFSRKMADWVTLKIDETAAAETETEDQTVFHFEKVGALDPGDHEEKTILFQAEAGLTRDMTGLSGTLGPMGFTVYIHAVQID